MRSQEELKQALHEHPDSFDVLYEYAITLIEAHQLKSAFALVERAIAIYDEYPDPEKQDQYFEMKRTHSQMLRDNLPEILQESWPLLDSRWMPIFKLGRPREIAWLIGRNNLKYLPAALHSDQLRRLRFLSITITDSADEVLNIFRKFRFEPLRVLNCSFMENPSIQAFSSFWETSAYETGNITSLSIRMPHLTDDHALAVRRYQPRLDSLSLLSLDRTCISAKIADSIADDPNSNSLTSLSLIGTSIGDKGLWTLLTSDNFNNLQVLDLHDGVLTNASARLIAADTRIPQLRSIDVRYNTIDPAGLSILKDIPIEIRFDNQHTRPAGRI